MQDFINSIASIDLWLMGFSFVLGIVVKEFVLDRFSSFFNKNRHKQNLSNQGLPGVYTVQIKNQVDADQLSKRIADCTILFNGAFVIRGDVESTVELELEQINPPVTPTIHSNIRFIHIENHLSNSCGICDVSEPGKRKVRMNTTSLSYIKPSESIGILMDEYKIPEGITLDYNGEKISYKIRNNTGSIKGEILD